VNKSEDFLGKVQFWVSSRRSTRAAIAVMKRLAKGASSSIKICLCAL